LKEEEVMKRAEFGQYNECWTCDNKAGLIVIEFDVKIN
jgi:hypothetical protein